MKQKHNNKKPSASNNHAMRRENATKFECWVTKLVYDLGNRSVRWDVHYTRGNHSRRQVDVQFYMREYFVRKSLVVVECKYSSNPDAKIGLNHYMSGKGEKNDLHKNIVDLIDDVDERRLYIGARYGVLVTNAYFTDELEAKAEKTGIWLWNRDKLEELSRSTVSGKLRRVYRPLSLEEEISKINIAKYFRFKG